MWKVKPPIVFPMETRYRPILESLVPPDPMSRFHLRRESPDQEFPDLNQNTTWMARVLTRDMYRRQFQRCTDSGVTFDDVIRPGLEEPGAGCGRPAAGCLAGDAQSYVLFCDFFDRVIEAQHGHKVSSRTPESDFNYDNLKGGDDLDMSHAVRCEVDVVRGVEGFCFPTHCSRGERRRLLALALTALQRLPGRLHLLEDLDQDQQNELNLNAPSAAQCRTGVARDWPDARAVWRSENGDLLVWVNMDDHLRLVCRRDDANVNEAFKCISVNQQKLDELYRELRHPFTWRQQLGWVSSSPSDVGTGLRVKVHLRLKLLPGHRRTADVLKRLRVHMEPTESPAVFCVSNVATFGMSEVELTQLVVDAVKLLVAMETRLEDGQDIEPLVPAQK